MSDKLCRENGLSVVVPGKGSKGKSYAEYQAEKTGTSWKGKLKTAVDALIPQVSSFEELLTRLQAAGYEIKPGKYVSCRAPGQERFTRLKTLGADYTEEEHHVRRPQCMDSGCIQSSRKPALCIINKRNFIRLPVFLIPRILLLAKNHSLIAPGMQVMNICRIADIIV